MRISNGGLVKVISKITPKQKAFCEEYIIDLNATQAAIRAGYKKDYADRMAHKLVENSRVKEYIEECMANRAERVQVKQDDVLKELIAIAFSNITNFVTVKVNNEGQKIVDILETTKMAQSKVSAIAEIRQSKEGFISVKMYDKLKALELLGKHLGMFTDKIEHSGSITVKKLEDFF